MENKKHRDIPIMKAYQNGIHEKLGIINKINNNEKTKSVKKNR